MAKGSSFSRRRSIGCLIILVLVLSQSFSVFEVQNAFQVTVPETSNNEHSNDQIQDLGHVSPSEKSAKVTGNSGNLRAKPDEVIPAETSESEPAAGEPVADEPAANEPAAGEPAAGEPAAGEPAADEPAADAQAADAPAADAQAANAPAADAPAADVPEADSSIVHAPPASLIQDEFLENRPENGAPIIILATFSVDATAPLLGMPRKYAEFLTQGSASIDTVHVWNAATHGSDANKFLGSVWKRVAANEGYASVEDIFNFYKTSLREDDVVIFASPSINFLDGRRVFDFAERVRGNLPCEHSSCENVIGWISNSMGNPWQVKEGLVSNDFLPKNGIDVLSKDFDKFAQFAGKTEQAGSASDIMNDDAEAVQFSFSGRQASRIASFIAQASGKPQTISEVPGMLIEQKYHVWRDLGLLSSILKFDTRSGVARFHSMQSQNRYVDIPLLDGDSIFRRPRKERTPQTIWTNFAGREGVFDLQVRYVKELLDQGYISEMHIWDITCLTKEKRPNDKQWYTDRQWLHSLARADPRVKIATPSICKWHVYYEFYASSYMEILDDDVLLKVDDDVVFLDVKGVPSFVDFIRADKDTFFFSATVFNNDVAGARIVKHGLLPAELGPPMWGEPDKIVKMHRWLIDNIDQVLEKTAELRKNGVAEPYTDRCSINFIGLRGAMLQKAKSYVMKNRPDDEHAITTVALAAGEREQVYMGLAVAHATFFTQAHKAPEIIQMYKEALATNKIP
eukprot:CAMPEP_0171508866 /NCGR_PEP_ID=MMETSP0958-20121227/14429_1 /TAXON_ID=87120 /ORGANISM="Aurantiochytrium limacinum, Strain ATCCMYA-1381" /LENGTH=739 /DNA_ID=CAMNT_0012045995 /DNA_START=378 /DNA_END=2597 /DNA_ORIENTATION=-